MKPGPLPIIAFALLLTGCAGTQCLSPVGDPAITPAVAALSAEHSGRVVQWGGVVVEARNLEDRTEIEVLGYPLDSCGRPMTGAEAVGRFIILRPGYLETAGYSAQSRVSASGRLTGIREGRLGDVSYSFPLLEGFQVRRWPVERAGGYPSQRPWITIGVGSGGGGIGVIF